MNLRLSLAMILVPVFLVGCATVASRHGAVCEASGAQRVIEGVLTLGFSELGNALECPDEEAIAVARAAALQGDTEAQVNLAYYYLHRMSGLHPDAEALRQDGLGFLRCAAEGGSQEAQELVPCRPTYPIPFCLNEHIEELEPDFVYRHTALSIGRRGCDCTVRIRVGDPTHRGDSRHSESYAYARMDDPTAICDGGDLCNRLNDVREQLTPEEVAELDTRISAWKSSPGPCRLSRSVHQPHERSGSTTALHVAVQ
jgi:hypothetical protein